MSHSQLFRAKADEMLRLAAMALTMMDRRAYLDLASAWRALTVAAQELEARAARDGYVIPFKSDLLAPPSEKPDP
jgi:hypothetical protein